MHAFGGTRRSSKAESDMPKRLETSSVEPVREPYRDVPVNLITAPRNDMPTLQNIWACQKSFLNVCGNDADMLFPGPFSSSTRILHANPQAINRLHDVRGFFELKDGHFDDSKFSSNPLRKVSGNSSLADIGASGVKSLGPIISSRITSTASGSSKAVDSVECRTHIEQITHSMLDAEEQTGRMSSNGENQNFNQSYALMKPKSNEHYFNLAEADCKEIVRSSKSKNKSVANDKLRRARISEGIKALQNCLPYSKKRNKESAFDDLIDYVKFLKLQLKVLSESRLDGEETDHRFVHVEGYGHYLLHPQMSAEPLGEMMGQLMESNMQVANQLLESKGIALFPLEFAYTLLRSS
ncbi:transcription factor bHLH54-like isoform X3 [Ananas comosus]|uniref:Transcription factor bHLH54-like isoform X3 n=1 Tax=Ananas comosus TaxID=4615 RepID=A0A6P5GSQ7_ANACO|nr:transcription factor bHLH54-like isoform X3 [Ananas comosus]